MKTPKLLIEVLVKHGILMTITKDVSPRSEYDKWVKNSTHWIATFKRKGVEIIKTEYHQGPACSYSKRNLDILKYESEKAWLVKAKVPAPENVFGALLVDASVGFDSFKEWCDSVDYSHDSIVAKSMYDTCVETFRKLNRTLGRTIFEELQNSEQP